MCLREILPQNKKDEILNKITEKGLKVYKVAWAVNELSYPPFMLGQCPYEGVMNAYQVPVAKWKTKNDNCTSYTSGFHFFIDIEAAERLRHYTNSSCCRVIEATVFKSWITEIGTETSFDSDEDADEFKEEIVIVARKAKFS